MSYLLSEAIEGRIWAGSLHLYNAGYLVGEWFDIDQDTDASDLEADICEHIKDNLPKGENYEQSIDELHVFDHENMHGLEGECSPCGAVEYLAELAEKVENSGHDFEQYMMILNAGYCPDSDTQVYILSQANSESMAWVWLADETGDWDACGEPWANAVDWAQYYRDCWAMEYIDGDYVAFSR